MVVLGGGAVSYEQGTPVFRGYTTGLLLEPLTTGEVVEIEF